MALKPCKECGHNISEQLAKCPHCGIDDPLMARKPCTECGHNISEQLVKCPHCGIDDPLIARRAYEGPPLRRSLMDRLMCCIPPSWRAWATARTSGRTARTSGRWTYRPPTGDPRPRSGPAPAPTGNSQLTQTSTLLKFGALVVLFLVIAYACGPRLVCYADEGAPTLNEFGAKWCEIDGVPGLTEGDKMLSW